MIALLLVAPFWVGAYIAAGWIGVGVMAVLAVLGDLAIFGWDELEHRQAAARARERWSRWHG